VGRKVVCGCNFKSGPDKGSFQNCQAKKTKQTNKNKQANKQRAPACWFFWFLVIPLVNWTIYIFASTLKIYLFLKFVAPKKSGGGTFQRGGRNCHP
jgi:hypothetical protein